MEEIPLVVLKSCSILKLSLDDLTKKTVVEAWKNEIILHVFPEIANYAVTLNVAKDHLLRWLDERDGEAGVFAKLSPRDGSGSDALLSPTEDKGQEDYGQSS